MDSHRTAIESEYVGVANIKVMEDFKTDKGATKQIPKLRYSDVPCFLSFGTSAIADSNGNYSTVEQTATLFLSPKYLIPPNSEISVTQFERTYVFKKSGLPEVYDTHQEIRLERGELV